MFTSNGTNIKFLMQILTSPYLTRSRDMYKGGDKLQLIVRCLLKYNIHMYIHVQA